MCKSIHTQRTMGLRTGEKQIEFQELLIAAFVEMARKHCAVIRESPLRSWPRLYCGVVARLIDDRFGTLCRKAAKLFFLSLPLSSPFALLACCHYVGCQTSKVNNVRHATRQTPRANSRDSVARYPSWSAGSSTGDIQRWVPLYTRKFYLFSFPESIPVRNEYCPQCLCTSAGEPIVNDQFSSLKCDNKHPMVTTPQVQN